MAGLITYQDTVRREDLADILSDVSPDENPLTTMFGKSTASNTYHEWTEDYIGRPSSVQASAEGKTTTYSDHTQPSRRGNFTHILNASVKVSGTESAVDVAGMGDPFDYQKAKQLRTLKNNMEFAVLNSAAASGASGVARQMIGMVAVITSHATARNSGTSLSEDEFNDMVQDVWNDVGADQVFDMVLMPFGLKRKMSSFTAGATKNVDASDQRLTRPVSVYESDGGVHRLMPHKDVYNSAGTTHFLGIREDAWRIAYLKNRAPKFEDRPKDGDYRVGEWITELTVEFLKERTNAKRTGYNQTG